MKYSKKISVIVPVYNVESYLDKCISSILKQSYTNLEIILVNDGSTDNSLNICKKYEMNDNRIILINQKNQGVSKARNEGLKIATGDYIGFVDSDDYIDLDMYEFLYNLIEKDKTDVAICSTYDVKNDIKRHNKINNVEKEMNNIQSLDMLLTYGYYGSGVWDKLFSKEVIQNLYFSEDLTNGEELQFLYMALYNSKSVKYKSIPKYNYIYRSSSATKKLKVDLGLTLGYKKFLDFVNNKKNLNTLKKKLFLNMLHHVLDNIIIL